MELNEPPLLPTQDSLSYSTRPDTGSEIPQRDDPGAEVMNVDSMPPERGGPRRFFCSTRVDDILWDWK